TAARLEQANKKTGTSVLISDGMYRLLANRVAIGRKYKAPLKGKTGFYHLIELQSLKNTYQSTGKGLTGSDSRQTVNTGTEAAPDHFKSLTDLEKKRLIDDY